MYTYVYVKAGKVECSANKELVTCKGHKEKIKIVSTSLSVSHLRQCK